MNVSVIDYVSSESKMKSGYSRVNKHITLGIYSEFYRN